MLRALPCIVVCAGLSVAAHARADAIHARPDCPAGTNGWSSHAGRGCELVACGDGCTDDLVCERRRVCQVETMIRPGGRGGYGRPPFAAHEVVMTCAADGACTGTEADAAMVAGTVQGPPTCSVLDVCVRPSLPLFPPMTDLGAGPPPAPPDDDEYGVLDVHEEPPPEHDTARAPTASADDDGDATVIPSVAHVPSVSPDADGSPYLAAITPRRAIGVVGLALAIGAALWSRRGKR